MEVQVIADQGGDTNLISSKVLVDIQNHETKPDVRILDAPHTYRSVSDDICVTCEKVVTLDIHVKVRHGTKIIFRNIS